MAATHSRGRLVDDSGRSSRRQCLAVHRSVWCVSRCCSGRFFLVICSSTFGATLRYADPTSRLLRPGIRARAYSGAGTANGGPIGIKMRLRIHWILVSTAVVILAGCNAATEKEQTDTKQRTSASSTYNTFPDDLYLDDQDALEGSGRGGSDNRDDLEASGSGLGPDDEDGDDDHEFNGNNGLEIPSKPTEPKPPYYIEETNVKTKQQTTIDAVNRPGNEVDVIEPSGTEDDHADNTDEIHEVYIMNPKHEDRASSFFAQPGVLAAVIGGAVVGLLCAILVVMFIVYRMRKKDEGSYALDEPRRSPAAQAFPKPGAPHHNREFYA